MTAASSLLAEVHALGVTLAVAGDRLRVDAPAGVLDAPHWFAMAAHKAELLALLSSDHPDPFSARWGPSLDHADPGLDVPRDWRWLVANWPHWRWSQWRRRSGELEPPDATVEQIKAAGWQAYVEMTRGGPTAAALYGDTPGIVAAPDPMARVEREPAHCEPDYCRGCSRRLTWAERRAQFARLLALDFTEEQAEVAMPRCQKCMTVWLRANAPGSVTQ